MQAASVPYNKIYEHPVYPFYVKEAQPSTEEQSPFCPSSADQERINKNALLSHAILRTLNIPYEEEMLKAICTIAHSTLDAATHVIKPAKFLETSIVVVAHGEAKRVYVVRKDEVIKKESTGKISNCLMLTFDKDKSLKEVRDIVRHAFPFKNDESRQSVMVRRQLACMQTMAARPDLFAENFDFVEAKRGKIYVYQELATTDLLDVHNSECKINKLDSWLHLAKKVVEAVHYMHSKGYAHCDLKLENILTIGDTETEIDIKLSDFGYSSLPAKDPQATKMRVGSRVWAAPEVLTTQEVPLDLLATDIWSLGHILFIFVNGRPSLIHTLLNRVEEIAREHESNKMALAQLHAMDQTLEALANSAQDKLSEPLWQEPRQLPKADSLRQRQLYCIALKFEAVFHLLQNMSSDNFAKRSIYSQLEYRRSLIEQLSKIKHLMTKAAITTENPPVDPLFQAFLQINLHGERPWQKSKRIITYVCKSLFKWLQDQNLKQLPLVWSQCVQMTRLVAATSFSVERIKEELVAAQNQAPILEQELQKADLLMRNYLETMRQEVHKEATCLQEAPQAMMRYDPASRLSLQTLLELIQNEIDKQSNGV